MRQLFGTDGIRAKAGEFPLDSATMWGLGKALGIRLASPDRPAPVILLGMDTRESGPAIAKALVAGIKAGGGTPSVIGVIPTPGVAYLCRSTAAEAGISISASHNPFEDNGVKIFGSDGMKLSDQLEKEIEDELLHFREEAPASVDGEVSENPTLLEDYERFLWEAVPEGHLRGSKIVLDAGNGAAYRIGRDVFARTGAEIVVINDEPDGRNINANSGALHPEHLARRVVQEKAAFGVAFDGDADRAIFVDDEGNIRNGDEIIFLWALYEKERGKLKNDLVVTTVMSNFGFERALEKNGIRLLRAAVGDKYVLEMMLQHGAVLGGEQSGHIIDLQLHTTGDGLHTALEFAEILHSKHERFSDIRTFQPMPQVLKNEKVAAKPPLESLARYSAAANRAQEELGSSGRILVRYSGTENLVRVMVEGEDATQIETIANELCNVLRTEIGHPA